MLPSVSSPTDFGFVDAVSPDSQRGPESQRMLADPFVGKTPPPPPVPPLAPAALAAALLAAFPLFSFASIFVGIRGLTQTRLGTMRGRTLAIAAIVAGSVFSIGYSATAAVVTIKLVDDNKRAEARETKKWERKQRNREADRPKVETPAPVASGSSSSTPSTPTSPNNPNGVVPEKTAESMAGSIRIVEMGFGEASLKDALIREQAIAKKADKQILVMTTRGGCQPCASVIAALPDSRMQEALSNFQIVRVDVEVFKEELIKLHYDSNTLAGFFLLAPTRDGSTDGTPKDGINSGEWGADVAENVAPVLRSFVRGEYRNRKNPFKMRPNGTFL